jgi:hypothetical protein
LCDQGSEVADGRPRIRHADPTSVAGTFNETLKNHGIDDDDASYYGERLKDGGVLVTAQASGADAQRIRETPQRHGRHSASHAKTFV